MLYITVLMLYYHCSKALWTEFDNDVTILTVHSVILSPLAHNAYYLLHLRI